MVTPPTVLRTANEKVQFYRDALLGNDDRLRIVVGKEDSGKREALQHAFDAIKSEGIPCNQHLYGYESPVPLENLRQVVDAIHFIPKQTLLGAYKEVAEYGSKDCEVVIFM
jgi:hypothetical protein